MNQRPAKGWFKHADFIFLDMLFMQACFVLAYYINSGTINPYRLYNYAYQAKLLFVAQALVSLATNNYKNILKRGKIDEFISIFKYTVNVLLVAIVYMFMSHTTHLVSRMQMGATLTLFVLVGHAVRTANKERILKARPDGFKREGRSLVLITSGKLVDEAVEKLNDPDIYIGHFISGIIVTDNNMASIKGDYKVPVLPLDEYAIVRLRRRWVDEVFILQPSDTMIDKQLLDEIMDMGITINFTLAILNDENWTSLDMRKLGGYKVLTSSIHIISFGQALIKRVMDIAGGIFGCIITGILFIFVAPAIYIKSPGPIFFAQDRVGLGGKVFKMYKFRSMFMDAEERKAELMSKNKVENDLMFKMDDDPRIIGSEEKDSKGRPRGIGNFIRNTSIERSVIMNLNQGNLVFARVSSILSCSGYSRKMPIIAQNRGMGIMYARA